MLAVCAMLWRSCSVMLWLYRSIDPVLCYGNVSLCSMCYAQTKLSCGMLHSSEAVCAKPFTGCMLCMLCALYAMWSVLYVFMCATCAARQASRLLLQLCMLSQVSVSAKCAVGAKYLLSFYSMICSAFTQCSLKNRQLTPEKPHGCAY